MRPSPSRALGALFVTFALATACRADDAEVFSRRNPITEAVNKTKSAIVTVKVPNPRGGKDMVGTGVLVDERGIIVTNRHVVDACKHPTVHLHDGTVVTAEVLFAEARWDLAALRIRTDKKLPFLRPVATDDLMVGETVIAIGHPYGYSYTVSRGIISALGREIEMPTHDVLTGMIQTDASINPGNSGGPLLNINGELIGINSCLRDGAQGIAFAISSNTVNAVLSKVLSAKRMAGVNHGLTCAEKILSETGDRQRVVVASFEGEAAEGKELKAGDEIRSVGTRTVVNAFDVERSLWDAKPGETIELQVERRGKSLVVALTLAASTGAGQSASAATADAQSVAAAPLAKIVSVSER